PTASHPHSLSLHDALPISSVSVVVCSYNGARTIRQTCEELRKLQYDNFEVIVVDDGSTDGTAEIARAYGFRVIVTRNRGLSHARSEEHTSELQSLRHLVCS